MYLPEHTWQPTVAHLIRRARLVVVTLAPSAGTMWELAEAMRVLPPQRLLLMVPPLGQEMYEAIREKNLRTLRDVTQADRNPTWQGQSTPMLPGYQPSMNVLRPNVSTSGLIHFSRDWQASFAKIRYPDRHTVGLGLTLFYFLRRGLRPALEELSAHERRTGWHCG